MAKKRPNTSNNLSQTTSKKQKQAKPSTQVQSSESDPIVIDMDEDNNSNDETTKQPQNLKRSWVWNHFEEDGGEAICQVIVKPSRICGARLRRDKSRSTKNLHTGPPVNKSFRSLRKWYVATWRFQQQVQHPSVFSQKVVGSYPGSEHPSNPEALSNSSV
ncbi:hypothetical protein PCANC_18280 [Puccinia coronata f. sp. avenae]|uniref:Uncharacterized protein n=1 Tax=Puccinia coronata f. sp. avenae TaxID=200324 RepID=A0A2N5UFY8_9BASI|nr:hypothetical protein PCANC_18280 [Puccinia coronata f. sp. avenae]